MNISLGLTVCSLMVASIAHGRLGESIESISFRFKQQQGGITIFTPADWADQPGDGDYRFEGSNLSYRVSIYEGKSVREALSSKDERLTVEQINIFNRSQPRYGSCEWVTHPVVFGGYIISKENFGALVSKDLTVAFVADMQEQTAIHVDYMRAIQKLEIRKAVQF